LIFIRILFSISIITPGKYATIRADAIPKLLTMLNDESTELIVNALKVCVHMNTREREKRRKKS